MPASRWRCGLLRKLIFVEGFTRLLSRYAIQAGTSADTHAATPRQLLAVAVLLRSQMRTHESGDTRAIYDPLGIGRVVRCIAAQRQVYEVRASRC